MAQQKADGEVADAFAAEPGDRLLHAVGSAGKTKGRAVDRMDDLGRQCRVELDQLGHVAVVAVGAAFAQRAVQSDRELRHAGQRNVTVIEFPAHDA